MRLSGRARVQIGKWDVGMATVDHTPRGRGYDSSFGYFHHDNDYWTERLWATYNDNGTVQQCGSSAGPSNCTFASPIHFIIQT